MIRISAEAKQVIITKVLSKNGQKVSEIALENNIGLSTLNKWVKFFKLINKIKTNPNLTVGRSTITLPERFKHLQATFGKESVMGKIIYFFIVAVMIFHRVAFVI